jgi:hypothetical protein
MTGRRPFADLTKNVPAARKARIAGKAQELKSEMALHELRSARDPSQVELARKLKVGQPAVAKLERRTDTYVGNLRRYVEALGGSLEITAKFPDAEVAITNFEEIGEGKSSAAKRQRRPARTSQ